MFISSVKVSEPVSIPTSKMLLVSTADGLFVNTPNPPAAKQFTGNNASANANRLVSNKENKSSTLDGYGSSFLSLNQGKSPKAVKLLSEQLWVFDKHRLTIIDCSAAASDGKCVEIEDKSLDVVSVCQYKGAVIVVATDSIDLWQGKLLTQLAAPLKSSSSTVSVNSKPSSFYSQLISQHRLHIVSRDNRRSHCAVVGDFLVLGEEQRITIFNLVLKTKHSFKLDSRKSEIAINCIAGSHFKRSLIAMGWTDGSVQLVDVHLLAVVHTFPNCHSAPVTDLSFSPFNRFLLISGTQILWLYRIHVENHLYSFAR